MNCNLNDHTKANKKPYVTVNDCAHPFDDTSKKKTRKVALERTNYKPLLFHDRVTITVNGKTFKLTTSSTKEAIKESVVSA